MIRVSFIGGCVPCFLMAVVFDILGFVLLMFGIFGDVRLRGVFYGDFLIHTGALILFSSLALWLMWYVGNIQVTDDSLERRSSATRSVKELARKLTERLSKTHMKNDTTGEKTAGKSSTIRNVTWGKSTYFPGQTDPETDTIKCEELSQENTEEQFMCFQNKGYEDEEPNVSRGEDVSQDEKIQHDQTQTAEEPKSDDTSQEKTDEEFTCYQNESYEESDSSKDGAQPADQTEAESFDTLL